MDDFDNMFSDVGDDTVAKEEVASKANNDYSNSNNNYGEKKKFDNKPIYTNVEGDAGRKINVWDGDRIQPQELDLDSLKTSEKFVTMIVGNMFYKLDETELNYFKAVAKILKEKGFKLRVVCSFIKPIFKEMKEIFGDDMMLITPWKGHCKDLKEYKQYLSSDSNLKAASYYFNNKAKKYNELPAGTKLVMSAVVGSLVGQDNNELSQLVIMHDRNYDGKRIDFKQSSQTKDYIILSKPLRLNIYNLAVKDDLVNLKQILS